MKLSTKLILGSALALAFALPISVSAKDVTPTNSNSFIAGEYAGARWTVQTTETVSKIGLYLSRDSANATGTLRFSIGRGGTSPLDALVIQTVDIDITTLPVSASAHNQAPTYFNFPTRTFAEDEVWYFWAAVYGVDYSLGELNLGRTFTDSEIDLFYPSSYQATNELGVIMNPIGTGTIEFNGLEDGQTYADFDAWSVNLNGTVATGYYVKVFYAPAGDESNLNIDSATWQIPYATQGFQIPKSRILWDATNAEGNVWGAQAILYNTDDEIVGQTETIIFQIDEALPFTYTPTSTSPYAPIGSVGAFDFDCAPYATSSWSDTLVDGLGCIMKKTAFTVSQFLFVPGQSSTGFIGTAYENFKGTFPFSIFFSINKTVQNAVTGFSSSSPSTLALTVAFPNSATSSVTILNSTTLADHGFSATVLNWWYNLILMGAILALAYGIFKIIYHPHS